TAKELPTDDLPPKSEPKPFRHSSLGLCPCHSGQVSLMGFLATKRPDPNGTSVRLLDEDDLVGSILFVVTTISVFVGHWSANHKYQSNKANTCASGFGIKFWTFTFCKYCGKYRRQDQGAKRRCSGNTWRMRR
ncbi:hypothetical protein SAMN06265222_108229, partial [Neorhodopirellula lusitana]